MGIMPVLLVDRGTNQLSSGTGRGQLFQQSFSKSTHHQVLAEPMLPKGSEHPWDFSCHLGSLLLASATGWEPQQCLSQENF